jgi:hypothetical protein
VTLVAHDQQAMYMYFSNASQTNAQAVDLYIRAGNSRTSALLGFSSAFTLPYTPNDQTVKWEFQLGPISYTIADVDTGDDVISIAGDFRVQFAEDDELQVQNSTGNDGTYTIDTVTYDGTNTLIYLKDALPDTTVDGEIVHSALQSAINQGGRAQAYMEVAACDSNGDWETLLPPIPIVIQMPMRSEELWDASSGFVLYPTNSFYTQTYIDNNFYTKTATDTLVASGTVTFTNKTFNCTATGNSLTNIKNTNVASDAAIAHTKIDFTGVASANQILYGTGTGLGSEAAFAYNPSTNTLSADIVSLDSITFDTAASAPSYTEGKVYWNTTDKCLDVMSGINTTVLQVGQEQVMKVLNRTGSPILNGKAVYVTGSHSNRPTVALARANAYATSRVLGLVTADIADGAEGFVTMVGLVRDLNTNSYSEGTALYLSAATAGEWTSTEPTAPNYTCYIGTVVRQQTTIGSIAVHVTNGVGLHDLADVDGTAPVTGSLLVRTSASVYDPTTTLLFDNTEKKLTHTGKSGQSQNYLEINSFGSTGGNLVKVDSAGALWAASAKLGSGSNYTEFLSDGTLVMNGTATVWDDLRIEPVARATGTNTPASEAWFTDGAGSRGVPLYSFDDADVASEKELPFTMQMPHDWAGTPIYLHIHWVGNNADTTAEPLWAVEYVWKNIGGVYGNTSTITTTGAKKNGAGTTDPDVTSNMHYISTFAALTPTAGQQDGFSSILIGRLYRNSSSASDTYDVAGNKCGLLYIDAHYERNRLGTRQEYSNT